MYDDSIIVLYGDHYGISEKHNRAMAQFLEKDQITEFDTLNLQRTPLYIHIPGQTEGRTISKPTGQIDMKPTILNLLELILQTIFVLAMICFRMNMPVLLFYVMVASLQTSMHTKQYFL